MWQTSDHCQLLLGLSAYQIAAITCMPPFIFWTFANKWTFHFWQTRVNIPIKCNFRLATYHVMAKFWNSLINFAWNLDEAFGSFIYKYIPVCFYEMTWRFNFILQQSKPILKPGAIIFFPNGLSLTQLFILSTKSDVELSKH